MNDEEDKGRKTNSDRDFKPEHEERKGYAPRGAEGRPAAGMAGPGLGGSSRGRVFDQTAQEQSKYQDVARDEAGKIQFRKTEDRAHDPDKPYVIKTGDSERDKELEKDHNVVSREEAEKLIGKEEVAKIFYDEPSKEASPERENSEDQVSKEEAERLKAQEIAAKFRSDREQDKGRGH